MPERTAQTVQLSRKLEKLGSGRDAVIALRLCNGAAVSGWVAHTAPDSLEIVNPKTGEVNRVYYSSVSRMAGYNLATGVQVQDGTGLLGKLSRVMKIAMPAPQARGNSFTKRTTLIIGVVVGVLLAIILAKVL